MKTILYGKFRTLFCIAACFLVFTGCSTTKVPLTYDPTGVVKSAGKAANSVAVTVVTDNRKNDPNWLGAIRGGFGNPLKTLETSAPVKDYVKTAYIGGLKARGLWTSGAGRYDLQIDIRRYDSSQYVRREAHIDFDVILIQKSSSKKVYDEKIVVTKVTGDGLTFDAGIFASVEDLRIVANQALQEAIDKTLNDPRFVGALK